jgi:macrolide transport system ATP-binding/permease protein
MSFSRLQGLYRRIFGRRAREQSLDDEVRSYAELLTEQKIREGTSPEDARRRAQMEIGGIEQVKEEVREARKGAWLDTLVQDVQFGARVLRKNPGFTIMAVLTLALGIGVNTAIFSMVNSLLLRPMPVPNPEQITVLAYQQERGSLRTDFSYGDFRDLRKQTAAVFSGLAGYQIGLDGISTNGRGERLLTGYVSGNFFSMLSLQPALGRLILPSEGEAPNADPVVVLGYAYWKSHFAGNPAVIGSKVSVNGHPVTIVGVAPESFHGPYALLEMQAYLPFGMLAIEGGPPEFMTDRKVRDVFVVGRLQASTDIGQAQQVLNVVAGRLAAEYPKENKGLSIRVFPEVRARPNPDPDNTIGIVSILFLCLAGLVLLLACGNVANILLVRATVREREMAIRTALGAGRVRLIRQLLTESILLALFGSAAGVALGCAGSAVLSSIQIQTDLPVRFDFGLDWRILAYAVAAALLAGIVVGIVPALRSSRGNLNAVLRTGGRGVVRNKNTLRTTLVVAQVAGSLMLLVVAGLFTRSLTQARRTNLGFNPGHLLNLSMDPVEIAYSKDQSLAFFKELLQRVRTMPGVESACTAAFVPMGYINNADTVEIPGYEIPPGQPPVRLDGNVVYGDYFQTLEIPVLRGRVFSEADDSKTRYVAVINDAMAKKFWPNQDPIGRTFRINADMQRPVEIVGIVGDARYNGVTGAIRPYFYIPYLQHFDLFSMQTLQVRTSSSAGTMLPELQRTIGNLAPQLPVFDVKTMEQGLNTLNGFLLFQIGAGLAAALGILGLILAVVGVYGVISYATSQKTQEIGIRLALGANPGNILKSVLGQGLLIIGIGLLIGLGAAFAAARLIADFVTVSPTDPLTYIFVSMLLALVALAACYVPAHRAMRVDPMIALRYE